MIYFGPAGNSDIFYRQGFKSSLDMPKWLADMGLNAYEYQCGNGVRISEPTARAIGEAARAANIKMSIHAPYYISLSSPEKEKRDKSIHYILDTLKAATYMGADRIVVHSGSCSSMTRIEALALAKQTLKNSVYEADLNGFSDIHICMETMGKLNQLGTVDEVMELCGVDLRILPVIDFGHVHTRTLGGLKEKSDFKVIFDTILDKLGQERARAFHIHYSRIEFTKGGEKRHRNFLETEYGPEFLPIAELIFENKMEPVIICESAGTMAEDAMKMKDIYEGVSNNEGFGY